MYADPSGYMFTIIETQLRLAMENILRNMEQIHYTGMFCGFASAIDTALSGEGDVMTSFMQGYVTGVAGASILYGLMAFPSIMLEVKMLIGVFQSVGVGLGLYYMNEAWDDGNVPLAVYRTVMTTADIMTLYQEFGPQISDALGDSWNRFIHDNRGGFGLLQNDIKTDYYVTPAGDVVPASRAEFDNNLSYLSQSGMKYTGETINGPVRVRVEEAHIATPGYSGPIDNDHLVNHVHVEHRQNGSTGAWGRGANNNTSLPQSWFW